MRGYTLLEILLVISALGILLGAVYSFAAMFVQVERYRTMQTQHHRNIRNWTQMINDDFRSAIQDTGQSNQASGGETIRHFGVSGTSSQLRIDISSDDASASGLRTVFYEFQPESGLVRTQRDYAAPISIAETVQNAPEIINGQFQYFDGGTWHEQWVSLERKSVPTAIEIIFYSLPSSQAERYRRGELEIGEPLRSREVVQIPSGFQAFESYQRAQAPRLPEESRPPSVPSSEPVPVSPPLDPFRSLFGEE